VDKRVNKETLSQIFKRLFSSPFVTDEITLVWHAGEPLLLPISFYEEAFQIMQQWNAQNVRVINSFQTNATCITQDWCDFFKRQKNVQIGVSVDGPQPIHDANRVDWAGKGTFARVLRGITLLKENQIPFSVIAVVTKDSVLQPDALWQFFTQVQPARLGLNPEEVAGINTQSSLQTDEDIDAYHMFFQQMIELQAQTSEPIVIREAEFLMKSIQRGSLFTRSQSSVPMSIISFDNKGNISTFSPELLTMEHPTYGNFIFGNVFEDSLEDVLKKQKFIEVNEQIQRGVLRCLQSCPYFMFCGGGSPSNKISENGTFDSTETKACRLRTMVTTDAMLEHLEEQYSSDPLQVS
jgi:uncharacterized protein